MDERLSVELEPYVGVYPDTSWSEVTAPCAGHSPAVRCGACSHVPFPEPPRRMDCAVGGHSPAVRCGGCRD